MKSKIATPKDVIDVMMQVEGKKVQVNRAQMSEVYSTLSEAMYVRPEIAAIMIQSGKKEIEKQVGVSIDEMAETIERVMNE